MPCNEAHDKPILEKCPARQHESSRGSTPPAELAVKEVKPPCEWQKSEDGTACETVQSPCDEQRSEKPPIQGCPLRSIESGRKNEAPKALSQQKLLPTCSW